MIKEKIAALEGLELVEAVLYSNVAGGTGPYDEVPACTYTQCSFCSEQQDWDYRCGG